MPAYHKAEAQHDYHKGAKEPRRIGAYDKIDTKDDGTNRRGQEAEEGVKGGGPEILKQDIGLDIHRQDHVFGKSPVEDPGGHFAAYPLGNVQGREEGTDHVIRQHGR